MNMDLFMSIFHVHEMVQNIKFKLGHLLSEITNSTNYKSLDLCYLNVYDEEGYLNQSIESIYGLQYDDTLSQFKIDSNKNLANLYDKYLTYYDSKSEFIKLVKILVDREIKGEYDYQDVKFCIDNNEKFHYLYDLTIFYHEIEDDTE